MCIRDRLTDYPTIGGYPKIANIISADYNLLIQKTPGEKIFFKLIELHEAEQLYKEHIKNIYIFLTKLANHPIINNMEIIF